LKLKWGHGKVSLSTLKILPSVEMWLKSKGWGRGMILWQWFWRIGTMMMSRETSGWMSVSDESGSFLVLFQRHFQVYRSTGEGKGKEDRWKEEVTLGPE